uniref:non-specific serine/threonine protein kinase n=1 Tax=Astatotilapia calliptera TaxID=8154 RepID=A0AAX7UPV5_ASTCA
KPGQQEQSLLFRTVSRALTGTCLGRLHLMILVWKELDYGTMAESEKQMLVSKVNLLRELKHPNIVRYYDRIIDWTNTTLYIVMEYCEGSDLSSLISRCITFLVFVMVLGLLTQHNWGSTTFVGTPYYMSPEQINRMSYNEKSDIWSLGCLLYELCALSPPFTAYNQKELAEKIREGKFRRIPYRYSEELNTLLVIKSTPLSYIDDVSLIPAATRGTDC